jgi:hypothetical protein
MENSHSERENIENSGATKHVRKSISGASIFSDFPYHLIDSFKKML